MFMLLRVNLIRYIDNQLGDLSSYKNYYPAGMVRQIEVTQFGQHNPVSWFIVFFINFL
jgi:hypothetical protein